LRGNPLKRIVSYGWAPFAIINLTRPVRLYLNCLPVALCIFHVFLKMACWIRGCTTKGGKKDSSRKKSLFTACTEKMYNNWCDNGIAARGINEFSKKSRICELHFQKDNILREDIFHMADGATITVQRKVPKLKEDAVPSIFPSEIISYCRLNLINEEQQKEQQDGETSITTQLKSTVNCSVSVPANCESDNLITHYEQGCSVNADNNKLQTWPEIKRMPD